MSQVIDSLNIPKDETKTEESDETGEAED